MNVKHIQESFRLSLVFDVSKALCITICIICFFNICFGFRKKLKLRCLTHQKDCRRVPQSDPGLDVISLLIAGSPCIVT